MIQDPTDVRVNHKNARHKTAGKVSVDQGSVVEDAPAYAKTGNEAEYTRFRSIYHCVS
jgi:hypothetical protein